MPTIPLGLSDYQRSELIPLTLKNYFTERTPVDAEDGVALIPRPRLKAFGDPVGTGPIRGLYRKGNVMANSGNSGRTIVISGTQAWRVSQFVPPAAPPVLLGSVEGSLRMSAEGNENHVVFTCGTQPYATNGNSLSEIAFPDDRQVAAVDTLNGYFLFASELGRFYWSDVGGITVSALDYATAESQPDVLLTLKVAGDELWLFGRYSVEVWQPTGDVDLPFQRIGGRIFGIGVTGRETVQKVNYGGIDTVCWVGTDRRIYMTAPNPTRISDHGMEARLKRVEDPVDLYAHTDNWHGHDFYVLHIPGEGSFAFDLSTRQWAQRTSHGRELFRGHVSSIGPNNQPLLGDDETATIWELSDDVRLDGGADPVGFEFCGVAALGSGRERCANVSVDVATGLNPDPEADPTMLLEWSDDMGGVFEGPLVARLGRQGERRHVAAWWRLPMMRRPGRLFRWRTSEPATVRDAKLNEPLK